MWLCLLLGNPIFVFFGVVGKFLMLTPMLVSVEEIHACGMKDG